MYAAYVLSFKSHQNKLNFKQNSSISNIVKISSDWCYGICGVIVNIIPTRMSGSKV